MSLVTATPYRAAPVKPPITIEAVPIFGMGRFEAYDPEDPMWLIVLATQHSDFETNSKFYLPAATEENYFYYMAPEAFGDATFTFNGFNGGWDGANWPLDDMGTEYGPAKVQYAGITWNMYRTDWPGGLEGYYSVRFANV